MTAGTGLTRRRRRAGVLAAVGVPMLALALAATATATAATGAVPGFVIQRVSVSSSGEQAKGDSFASSISTDGSKVAFTSVAPNLVPGDTNGNLDAFVFDRSDGTTRNVSGQRANSSSSDPSLSGDGRFVAFASNASNLVSGDTNGTSDIFVRNLSTGAIQLVSRSSSGELGNGISIDPSLSGDGRLVAFSSEASNLTADVKSSPDNLDLYVRDLSTGVTRLVSTSMTGRGGNNISSAASLTRDGRFVVFFSWASDLVRQDTNASPDIFLADLRTGVIQRVSLNSQGQQGSGSSFDPSISDDGRFIAFSSLADNLDPRDTNSCMDVYVRDLLTAQTRLVSVTKTCGLTPSSYASVSGDGRFVAFSSGATDLVPRDRNGASDVFVWDMSTGVTRRISVATSAGQGHRGSFGPSINGDGSVVAFSSLAPNLVPSDTNGTWDAFVSLLPVPRQAGVISP